MATDILSTSTINSLVSSYTVNETDKYVTPLQNRKSKYSNLSSAYAAFSSKLSALKSLLTNLKLTGSDSLFRTKSATTSDSSFVTATASSSASIGAYSLRVNQLAKNDIVISNDLTSSDASALSGTHSFSIKTGDGDSGEFVSNVEVTFDSSETNETIMEKIADAINSDKAVVQSDTKTASSSYSGGASSFVIDLNGTETTISVNGGGTYEDMIDEIVNSINDNIDGLTAEKVLDSGNVSLKLTVENSSDYISISNSTGFDLVSDLNIGVTQEKGASGLVTASSFSPTGSKSQFSITSKETGVGYRITDLSDGGGSGALAALGLNLGTARTAYDQSSDPDTAGFLYSDITDENNLLNSKFVFNGLTLQRDSNSISDLVTGVTFKLNSVMQSSDTTVNMTVGSDVDSVKSTIQDFITKFNDLYTYLKSNSTSSSGQRGLFIGDTNASAILSSLTSISYTSVSGISTGSVNMLNQIGISFDSATGLSISDSNLLENKISENASQVEGLFNSTSGIANTLYDKINPYLGSGGYLALAKSSYDRNVTTYDDRIASTQQRINKSADNLRKNYEKLQSQIADLYSLQSLLSSIGSY